MLNDKVHGPSVDAWSHNRIARTGAMGHPPRAARWSALPWMAAISGRLGQGWDFSDLAWSRISSQLTSWVEPCQDSRLLVTDYFLHIENSNA
jgi:hypothetical protein